MTTRSKKKLEILPLLKSGSKKHIENSWVLLVKDSLLDNTSFSIITLPHPKHGEPAKYCLDEVNKKLYEVITFSEPNRSWLMDESVKSDGSLFLLTPINPLFFVLPRLKEQCMTRAVPLENLLFEKGFEKIQDFIKNLESIADLKEAADLKAYKYSQEKTYKWLEDRVRKLAKTLQEKNIHVTSGAVSATFVTSTISNEEVDQEFFLKYAVGIISEYLDENFSQTLEQRFNFKPDLIETIGNKRKSNTEENNDNKKLKLQNSDMKSKVNESPLGFEQSTTEVKKPKPLTSKEKARQKAASGTKTISSFFTKN